MPQPPSEISRSLGAGIDQPATTAPIVRRLFETHLTVADLARSLRFYHDVVGLQIAYEIRERGAAFLWVGEPGESMLGLWSLGTSPIGMHLHLAFAVDLGDLLRAPTALTAAGVTPLSFFAEDTDEPNVIGWMPAAAVYFRDPDGHMIEYLAMLDEPARPDVGIIPWSEWREMTAALA